MLHSFQRTISVRDFCRVLFRRRSKAFAFFVIVVGLVLLGILMTPKKYHSEAKLFVRLGRESVGLDPTATTGGQTISLNYSRESEIQSVQNLLESRVIVEHVVDKLGPACVLEEDLREGMAAKAALWLRNWLPKREASDAAMERERAVRAICDELQIVNPPKSHVFSVTYNAGSAKRAQQVLQAFLDACLEQYVRIHRNPSSRAFFVEQSQRLSEQVKDATKQLRDAKNEVGLVSVESQRKLLEEQLINLDREILAVQTELASTNNRIKSLKERVTEPVDELAASGLSTRALDDMRTQLYELQIRERELLAKFTPEHPQAIAIHEQVDQAQRLLARQELLIEISAAATQRTKSQSLATAYEQTKSHLRTLNEDEGRISELERRVEQLTSSHRIYQTNLEEARIDQELEAENITNIAVAQAPTFEVKALNRRAQLTLMLGLIVASLGSVGVAYVFEYFDDSLGTPLDVEARLGLPVVLSLPRCSEVAHLPGRHAGSAGRAAPVSA